MGQVVLGFDQEQSKGKGLAGTTFNCKGEKKNIYLWNNLHLCCLVGKEHIISPGLNECLKNAQKTATLKDTE